MYKVPKKVNAIIDALEEMEYSYTLIIEKDRGKKNISYHIYFRTSDFDIFTIPVPKNTDCSTWFVFQEDQGMIKHVINFDLYYE